MLRCHIRTDAVAVADYAMDHILVDIQFMQNFVCFHTVLIRIHLKINIVQHAHRSPEIYALGVVFLGKLSHNLGHDLRMLKVKRLFIVAFNKLFCLFWTGYVTHGRTPPFLL